MHICIYPAIHCNGTHLPGRTVAPDLNQSDNALRRIPTQFQLSSHPIASQGFETTRQVQSLIKQIVFYQLHSSLNLSNSSPPTTNKRTKQSKANMSFSSVFRRTALAPASAARAFSTTVPRPLAKITIIGNLADTPEVHPTSSGREILRYAVASNSGRGENRKTSWFRVTSFAEGAQRDYLMNLPKGCVS